MSNMIQIILIIIFAYIVGKKYIIPRIAAKRKAKNGVMITPYPVPDELQEALAKGDRKVTRFDMLFVDLAASDEQLEANLRAKVNEMLMLASARGTDVQLSIVQMGINLLVYVTYVV